MNQELCDRYWPGQDALGKRIHVWGEWYTVVGVVGNGKYRRLVYAAEPMVFLHLFQAYRDLVMIHARVSGDLRAYGATAERTVHELNADLPVFGVTTLSPIGFIAQKPRDGEEVLTLRTPFGMTGLGLCGKM